MKFTFTNEDLLHLRLMFSMKDMQKAVDPLDPNDTTTLWSWDGEFGRFDKITSTDGRLLRRCDACQLLRLTDDDTKKDDGAK